MVRERDLSAGIPRDQSLDHHCGDLLARDAGMLPVGAARGAVQHDALRHREPQPTPPARRTSPSRASERAAEAGTAAVQSPQSAAGGFNTYRETCPRDAERMFVCSTLNAFIQAGKVHLEPEQLASATMMLRRLWQNASTGKGGTLTATAAPQQQQERRALMAAE